MPAAAAERLIVDAAPRPVAADLHAVSIPAGIFTGDFVFWSQAGGSLLFALGDVAGKGIRAAVYMAMIQEELDHLVACEYDSRVPLESVVESLHGVLREEMEPNKFVSLVVGRLDSEGTMTLVNAGHWAPLVVRATGRIDSVPSTGPVLGLIPSPRWSREVRRLEAGDTVVLYTDGVVEAESPSEEEFGAGRVSEYLHGQRCAAPEEITKGLLDALAAHRGGLPQHDDVTILAIRRP